MCSPPLEPLEEGVHDHLRVLQGFRPGTQELAARRSQLVPAFRGARLLGVPLGADETVLLQCAQNAVEAAELGLLSGDEHHGAIDELVAVRGLLGEEKQKRRLEEALDASPNVPATLRIAPPGPRAVSMCETHIGAERR